MNEWASLLFLLLIFITCRANSVDEKYEDNKIFENLEAYHVLTLLEPRNLLQNEVYIEEYAEDDVSENSTCIKDFGRMQEALSKNFTRQNMWAFKMLDASSKIPSGLLEGNLVDLGMYDECIAIHGASEIRGQHCMYALEMLGNNAFIPISAKLSVCLPSSCSANTIYQIFNSTISSISESIDLNIRIVSVTCSPLDQKIWDSEFIICFALLVIFIAFLMTCTVCEIILERYDEYRKNKVMTTLMQFSFKKNAAAIFNMELSNGSLPVLHGLRFISMAWIVLGHEFMYTFQSPLINKIRVLDQWLFKWNSLYVFTAQYAVDTFFAISGFLLAYVFFKQMPRQKTFNLPLYYLHRFIRLTPAVIALFIFFIVFVPKVGSGPLWHDTIYKNTVKCREKWWPTFLYVQNFVHQDECLGHLWYLAVDMQLFWISPIILYPLYKKPKIGLIILTSFFLASVITPAIIIAVNEYSAASYLKIEDGLKIKEMFNNLYIVPHTRAAPWFMGVFLGYEIVNKNRTPTKFVTYVGWLLALGGFAFCSLFTRYFMEPDYTYNLPLEVFFTAASKVIWGFGVCWIIYTSIHRCGGIITKFLSCRIFLPLSRLSYCIYLVHMVIESMQSSAFRTVKYFSDYYVWYYCLGDFAMCIIVAILFSLLFESPILVLEKMIFKRKKESKTESRKELTDNTNIDHKKC